MLIEGSAYCDRCGVRVARPQIENLMEKRKFIKDISVNLLSSAALILTISLGLISLELPASVLGQIRLQIIWSSILFLVSIFCGAGLCSILAGSPPDKEKGKIAAQLLSIAQFWSFFVGATLMVWAVVIRLGGCTNV